MFTVFTSKEAGKNAVSGNKIHTTVPEITLVDISGEKYRIF
jgi:hypothetical protein